MQLGTHLGPETEVLGFSWGRALSAPYDVFHVHWPDSLLLGSSSGRSRLKRGLFRALLLRLWLRRHRIAVVRTLHDAHGQRTGSRIDRALLARLDRLTTLWICPSPATPLPHGANAHTIEHGDYRAWFEAVGGGALVPGRLLYFGLIRPHKGVPDLVRAFTALPTGPDGRTDGGTDGGSVSLRVVGTPTSTDIGAEVLLAALADDRVTVSLGHLSNQELAAEVAQAELVILPYQDLYGSEASVLALSCARPVLVPSNAATRALAAEVGRGWVFTYAGPLTTAAIHDALARCRDEQRDRADRPNLSAHAWAVIADKHRTAYITALQLAGRPYRGAAPAKTTLGTPAA
ncbi:glycosyl transferase [Cryobacterium adonitolivorans]|uniref:Glycosyl transferase n=1 Tax=Cryobacterium adonitolivorans TaxID=1259189 RepID=A0A4R8WCY5_9MICO|nr:glycosyl transferase [Cryobacterium adonitolivorans]TFC07204.1 glycosyl transferase [Cryobacterium adonitolivorans]